MTPRQHRCADCNRVIYTSDLERGLARVDERMEDTLGGPVEHETWSHTYRCEAVPRRLTEMPTDGTLLAQLFPQDKGF